MRAGGIVGDHAADGGAVGRRYVRGEVQSVRPYGGVEVVENAARLDADPALARIDLEDAAEVFREVEDDAGADGLSGLRGAAAARRDRHAELRTRLDRRRDVRLRLRHDDAERHDLINARVGGVQRPADAIEADFALETRLEKGLKARDIDGACARSGLIEHGRQRELVHGIKAKSS